MKRRRSKKTPRVAKRPAAGTSAEGFQRHGVILDNLLEGYQVIDADWRYTYVNEAVARQARHTRDQLLQHTMMEVFPGIERTELFDVLRRCMEQRTPHQMENRFVHPDGTVGWFELRIQPVPEGLLILSLDVTERQRAQEALRDSKTQFERLFTASPDGIIIANADGKILLANQQAETLFGYDANEMAELQVEHLIPARFQDHRALREAYMTNPSARSMGMGLDLFARRKDGSEFPVEIALSPLQTEAGGAVTATIRDVTERQRQSGSVSSRHWSLHRMASSCLPPRHCASSM